MAATEKIVVLVSFVWINQNLEVQEPKRRHASSAHAEKEAN